MNGSDPQRSAMPALPVSAGAGTAKAAGGSAAGAASAAAVAPRAPFLLRLATVLGLLTAVGGTALLAWWGDNAAESSAPVPAQAGAAVEQKVADAWRLLVPPGH